jgi:FeS assembly SUF system regulator
MIRITRLTDYGIVLLTHIAGSPEWRLHNVPDLAEATSLPQPTVSKILKSLAKGGMLESHRGVKGGYALARRPEEISVVDIIAALDGPIAITDCSDVLPGKCDRERLCGVRNNWQRINLAVREALESITLAEMSQSRPAGFVPLSSLPFKHEEKTEVVELCQQ